MKQIRWNPQRLNEAREKAGLSESSIAGAVGTSKQYWQRLVKGEVTPNVTTLIKICQVTRKRPSYFFALSLPQSVKQEEPNAA